MKLYDDIRNEIEMFASINGNSACIVEGDNFIQVCLAQKYGWSIHTLRESYTSKHKSIVIKRIRQSLTGIYTDKKKRLYLSVKEMLSLAASVKCIGCEPISQ